MAYSEPWNESTPPGTADADTLDTIIQNVKTSLRERLEQVIPDWDDDGTDPKVLGEGTARIEVDTEANRPGSPTNEGEVYFESDTGELNIADGGAWVEVLRPMTARVSFASNEALGGGTQDIDWDTVDYDEDSLYDNSTSQGIFRVSRARMVLVQCFASLAGSGTDDNVTVNILKNGSPVAIFGGVSDSVLGINGTASAIDKAAANDEYRVTISADATDLVSLSWFAIIELGII